MAYNYTNLNSQKALIWRIVHRDNIPWILDNGVHCASSAMRAQGYVAIGNADLINRRQHRAVSISPGGVLSDYVPFYFTPFSPMLLNILTGRNVVLRAKDEICILVSSLRRAAEINLRFVFTDKHAYVPTARFFSDLAHLDQIDWPLLQARNFKRDPENPAKLERYEAEALIHRCLPVQSLLGVICHTDAVKATINAEVQRRGLALGVEARPDWYF